MEIGLLLLTAGGSTRFGYPVRKQWLPIGEDPLWLYLAKKLSRCFTFKEVVVVGEGENLLFYRYRTNFKVVEGGESRQQSLKRGVEALSTQWVLATDVARVGVSCRLVERLLEKGKGGEWDCVVPFLKPVDTVVYRGETLERGEIKLIQTPQLSRRELLLEGLERADREGVEFTDDRGVIEWIGGRVGYIPGEREGLKLTHFSDLCLLKELLKLPPPLETPFVGIGYDTHRFQQGGEGRLGGVGIPGLSFKAHSDGDLLIHGVIDALLGAGGGGDIGEHFPEGDPRWKGVDSRELLQQVVAQLREIGFQIVNIDLTYIGERPRLRPIKQEIVATLRQLVGAPVNLKGTTNEGMGFIGRGEGAAVLAVANLRYKDWNEDCNCRGGVLFSPEHSE
ncbi:MAG: 2-C-methyl-D-erythritol 2,4-cyclodiphosphate synthase [Campylobacterales bacterium]